ncbi:MAG: UPF0147 family protein [Candidatus Nanoarchaeia archaeon]
MSSLDDAQELLKNLLQDSALSKSAQTILEEIAEDLKDKKNIEIKINSALQKIEELLTNPNLSIDVRTQIWSLSTLLESALKEI